MTHVREPSNHSTQGVVISERDTNGYIASQQRQASGITGWINPSISTHVSLVALVAIFGLFVVRTRLSEYSVNQEVKETIKFIDIMMFISGCCAVAARCVLSQECEPRRLERHLYV